jgi:hypothetical protein
MKKSAVMRNATVHLDRQLMAEVEALAEQERRPLSQLLRNLIADAPRSAGSGTEAAA